MTFGSRLLCSFCYGACGAMALRAVPLLCLKPVPCGISGTGHCLDMPCTHGVCSLMLRAWESLRQFLQGPECSDCFNKKQK